MISALSSAAKPAPTHVCGPRAKRNISAGRDLFLPVRHKPVWIKCMRRRPVVAMAMQRPWRDHHDGAFSDTVGSDFCVAHRDTRHKCNRRIKTQRFAEETANKVELSNVLNGDIIVADDRINLTSNARQYFRLHRQYVKRPRQRTGGCFMAGQKEDAELVNQLIT